MTEIIPYGRQQITEEDIAAVVAALKSDFLTQGPAVLEFEKNFARYVGAEFAVAVTNGTAALHLSALTLGVKPGQKVLTTPITFVASANCVRYCGGDVEFIDIDPTTYCLDLDKLATHLEKSKDKYAGIIPVDFAGHPVNLEKLSAIAKRYGMWVLEDACHAPGAEFRNSQGGWIKSGSGHYADLAIFSFHPVKHIACGEGGMITTSDKSLYEKLLLLRSHGITRDPSLMHTSPHGGWYYEQVELGYNYRISDVLCALGSSQLKRADAGLERRREIATRYSQQLANLPLKLPICSEKHAYHLYVVRSERRLELYQFLKDNSVHCQIHYIPVHQQPYYLERYGKKSLPVAENFYQECLSLPMFPSLTLEQQDKVIRLLKEFHE
jgi:UDP-4-amino-4,6-dideoxy-N-acetyl-beta-L-altrosamine transaminase